MVANVGLTASGAQVMSARPSRTRIAFAPTTIRIPFPWLRVVPVEEPEELTMRFAARSTAVASGGSFSAFPAGGVMPVAGYPMAGYPVAGYPMAAGLPVAGGYPMAAMPQVQAVPQAPAALVCPPCPPTITPERVQEFTRRIQELETQLRAAQSQAPAAAPCLPPAAPMAPTIPMSP
jgi:hypothetical protein